MPFIVLSGKLFDRSGIRGLGRKFPRIQKEAMRSMAEKWVRDYLPGHFTPGNRNRYRFERRNPLYTRKIKPAKGTGQGKYVELLLSGRSRRAIVYLARITATQDRATVLMSPPGYFTNPKTGSYRNARGQQKRISHQPDKVRELLELPQSERDALVQIARKRFHQLVRDALRASATP